MKTTDATLPDFDLNKILAMPESEIIYTPHNILAPQEVTDIGVLNANERRLFHFMIACEIEFEHSSSQSQAYFAEYTESLYDRLSNPEKLRDRRQKAKLCEDEELLLKRKLEASQRLFWETLRIRMNNLLPQGDFAIAVYRDNIIGLTHPDPEEDRLAELFEALKESSKKF